MVGDDYRHMSNGYSSRYEAASTALGFIVWLMLMCIIGFCAVEPPRDPVPTVVDRHMLKAYTTEQLARQTVELNEEMQRRIGK